MSGDLNDYLFAFIVLAVKNHNDGYVLSFEKRQSTVLTVKWERFINEIVIFCALSRVMREKLFLHLK